MKFLPKLVIAATALMAGAVGAQAAMSDQADQDRRARNREEALAAYHAQNDGATTTTRDDRSLRAKTHDVADTVRGKTHRTTQKVAGFTHRQAEMARDFGARHHAPRGAANTEPQAHGEGTK
jgi:hypothetical protein